MVNFHIFTIFPNIFSSYFNESILKRARDKKIIKIKIYNIRDFSEDKHRKVDDKPYGGGPGMVLKIEPLIKAVSSVFSKLAKEKNKTKAVIFSARGKHFDYKMARAFSGLKHLILIAGHYEGIDERLKSTMKNLGLKTEEISIGPYVLSGGEAPAMVLIDAVSRHIPGVLGKLESLEEKKGSYPAYTRPEVLEYTPPGRGKKSKKYRVPKVLLSGDHKKISEWRAKYGKII